MARGRGGRWRGGAAKAKQRLSNNGRLNGEGGGCVVFANIKMLIFCMMLVLVAVCVMRNDIALIFEAVRS